jgi:hypothetical protein
LILLMYRENKASCSNYAAAGYIHNFIGRPLNGNGRAKDELKLR